MMPSSVPYVVLFSSRAHNIKEGLTLMDICCKIYCRQNQRAESKSFSAVAAAAHKHSKEVVICAKMNFAMYGVV